MERYGELAAFGTAVFWTASALVFEGSSRRIGALAVNFWKVVGAFLLLSLAGILFRGAAIPFDAPARAWVFLSLSGLIGFVIADYFLFTAYVLVGSRVTVVFQALTPLFTAGFGFLLLGERMAPAALVGMATVVVGILVLVLARARSIERARVSGAADGAAAATGGAGPAARGRGTRGLVFAFLSSVFQALGLVTSKLGLVDSSGDIGGIDAISATQIRVLVAILGFGLQALLLRRARSVFTEPFRDGAAMAKVALGSVVGPFLGVVLSLYALQHSSAGTASTLMALTPVLIIPPSILIFRQRVAGLEIVGAVVAVAGTALFFLL